MDPDSGRPRFSRRVFVTGATGYLGRALIPALARRGHRVWALARAGSEQKAPDGCATLVGSSLDAESVASALSRTDADAVVHLVGVPKPSPAKARQFREIDLVSIRATIDAVVRLPPERRPHLTYVSVAQPAPVMRAYVAVRAQAEALIRTNELDAACLRPWYVLGPGHRWPCLLVPLYALLRRLPPTRAGATRLGLVTLSQMTAALVIAVEESSRGVRIVEVPEIRKSRIDSTC